MDATTEAEAPHLNFDAWTKEADAKLATRRAELAAEKERSLQVSRCQRVAPRFDQERGWAKLNGTIGCDIPEHGVHEPSPEGLSLEEHVRWNTDHAPPFSPGIRAKLGAIFASAPPVNPRPEKKPTMPRRAGKALDPTPGTLYGRHLRATPGTCQRCQQEGPREVDHCHEHHVVRGLICPGCNKLAEKSMGDLWRRNCLWCAWDLWLEKELSR